MKRQNSGQGKSLQGWVQRQILLVKKEGGHADDASNHYIHSCHVFRMSNVSPSKSPLRKPPFSQHNLQWYVQYPDKGPYYKPLIISLHFQLLCFIMIPISIEMAYMFWVQRYNLMDVYELILVNAISYQTQQFQVTISSLPPNHIKF